MAAPSDPQPSQNSEQKVQAETDALLKRLKDVFSLQDATSSQLADHKKLLAAETSRLEEQLAGIDQEIKDFYARREATKRAVAEHQKSSTKQLERQLAKLEGEIRDAVEALFAHTTNAQYDHMVVNARMTGDYLLMLESAARRRPEPDLRGLAAWLYVQHQDRDDQHIQSVSRGGCGEGGGEEAESENGTS